MTSSLHSRIYKKKEGDARVLGFTHVWSYCRRTIFEKQEEEAEDAFLLRQENGLPAANVNRDVSNLRVYVRPTFLGPRELVLHEHVRSHIRRSPSGQHFWSSWHFLRVAERVVPLVLSARPAYTYAQSFYTHAYELPRRRCRFPYLYSLGRFG